MGSASDESDVHYFMSFCIIYIKLTIVGRIRYTGHIYMTSANDLFFRIMKTLLRNILSPKQWFGAQCAKDIESHLIYFQKNPIKHLVS